MSLSVKTTSVSSHISSSLLCGLLRLPRIIIGTIKCDVSAVNILQEGLSAARELGIRKVLLALGPTSPGSLDVSPSQKILWATFLGDMEAQNNLDSNVVRPTQLTDLSINFERLSRTDNPVRLLLGDFLDSVLSVSSESEAFVFLSSILARIRESAQTAFFLLTEDMHDAKKITIVKRFADVVIEYRHTPEGKHGVERRILDYAHDYYSDWKRDVG